MRNFQSYIILLLIVFSTLPFTAQSIPEQQEKADSLYALLAHYNRKHHYDSSIYYADKLINHELNYGTDSGTVVAYNLKIITLKEVYGKLSEAFKLTLITYEKYCSINIDKNNCIKCNLIYDQLSAFMISIQDYHQGINYLNMGCNSGGTHKNNYNKALLYILLGQSDSALTQTKKAIKLVQSKNNPQQLISPYNQHGLILRKLKRYDEAIIAFSSAIKIVDSLESKMYGYVYGNLGSCYYEQAKFEEAYKHLEIDMVQSTKGSESYLNAKMSLADIDLKRKDYKQALTKLDNIQETFEKKRETNPKAIFPQELHLFEMYMNVYQALGNRDKYQYHLHEWAVLIKKDSQSNLETNKILLAEYASTVLKQSTLQLETEKELLNQKLIIKEQKAPEVNLILFVGALFITLFFVFFWWRNRKKAILKEIQLNLTKKEQDLLALKVQEEIKNVQLLSLELQIKRNFSTNLIKQLDQLENITKPEVKNIELYIQNELDIKSTRALLQNQMGGLSSNFYNTLKIKHPELNESEIAFAAMIVMKMTNKEIGISKNMSSGTIKTIKWRLKKKLNLLSSENLQDYLSDFHY